MGNDEQTLGSWLRVAHVEKQFPIMWRSHLQHQVYLLPVTLAAQYTEAYGADRTNDHRAQVAAFRSYSDGETQNE